MHAALLCTPGRHQPVAALFPGESEHGFRSPLGTVFFRNISNPLSELGIATYPLLSSLFT